MDSLDYSEYQYDFSNFKLLLDEFKELASRPYDSIEECLSLLKDLIKYLNEIQRISKGACIEFELDNNNDNRDHVVLTFNMFSRIFGLRERIFNKMIFSFKEEDVLNKCDEDLINYVKKIYYPKDHFMNIDDPDYNEIISKIDEVWHNARNCVSDINALKENTIKYIELNKVMLKLVKFDTPLDRELFLDGFSKELFMELIKYNFNNYSLEDTTSKIKLKEAMSLYVEAFNNTYSDDILEIYKKLLESNSVRYVVEKTERNFKIGTYASYGHIPKILINYDGTIDSLFGFIFELGHAFCLTKQNNNSIYDYEYNIFIGDIIGYVNELLLYDTLKHKNSPVLEDSRVYLSNMLYRANNDLKALNISYNAYYNKLLDLNTEELLNIYNDFGDYREVLGMIIAGVITKKLLNDEIDKDKYSKFIGMSGNIMIKDILNSIDINIDDINIIKEGVNFLKEFVK